MLRGALICLEGLDRTGKTTQTSLLLDRLNSHVPSSTGPSSPRAVLQKFPDRTTLTGQIINTYLTTTVDAEPHAIHLLFTANRWESLPPLLPLLESGTHVILDRYLYSGIAFSVGAKGLDYDWCKSAERGLPRPDRTIYLKIDEETQEKRGGWGAERYEKREVQRETGRVFERLCSEEGDWGVVEAGGSVEEVAEGVWKEVERALEWAKQHELRKFE